MIQKGISLSTGTAILSVYLWSQLHPNDALFLFASANLLVNILMVGLAALLVRVSFMDKFQTLWGYKLAAGGAVFCLLIAAAGLIFSGLNYRVYGVFGPLDFLLLAEAGIILSLCALTYEHLPYEFRWPRFKLPRVALPRPSPNFPRLAYHNLRHIRFS